MTNSSNCMGLKLNKDFKNQIDLLVYKHFDLIEDEINIIERNGY